ncbi:MAG TPA: helix-turn-helix domain-containing protein [Fibrobacteria bacterium]|nr:helix-turn-helix domain-containing protein [Fibrobacteria bacterium]HOX50044.1 helix-turn-helix domain-containing protein [Fibrobacteria bacterium]
MIVPQFVEALQALGFTGQEAALYGALLEHGEMSGYEAAKETGISRSNAYHALASLVDKGFASRVEGESTRYGALALEDVGRLVRHRQESSIGTALAHAPASKREGAPFLSVSGRRAVVERMAILFQGAGDRVYLAADAADLEEIRGCMEAALERGIRVTVLTNRGWELAGAVVHVRRKARGPIRLIADGRRVLTGELDHSRGECVYSENPHLVNLIKESLTNEIQILQAKESERN